MKNKLYTYKNAKMYIPSDPVNLILKMYPKESKPDYKRDICTPKLIASRFTMERKQYISTS